jgi:hypothetical protein
VGEAVSQPPVGITGVWLRTGEGQKLQVLVEVDGKWRLLRSGNGERYTEGEISQIWEARGFRDAHLDPVTERA